MLQVPVWDMLNHITGHCNVRLHHNSRKGALQMITTQPVAKGGELVNNYGPLSDSELLRRFGFIEPQANPHNGCKLPLAVVMQACYSATSESAATVADKMRFLRQHDLVPSDGWFTTDPHGQPQPHLIEAIRILLLPSAEYVTFKKQVDRWRCPLNRPLTQLQTVSSDITCVVHECATKRLEGLAVVHVGENDLAQSFPARAAQHVLRMECQALCGLQAWAKLQDGGSLVLLCRQVWQHVRTAT